jgi:acetyl-CoA synthetase
MNPIDLSPKIQHNLSNYDKVKATFSWKYCARELSGPDGKGLNIAYEAVDRHAQNHLKIQLHFVLFEKTEVPKTLPIPI